MSFTELKLADNFINDVLSLDTSVNPEDEIYSNILNINERKNRLTANNFIVGSSFTYSKNNQESILDENFSQFKFKSELVGNLLSLGMKLGGVKSNKNGYREIFNLAPSQYCIIAILHHCNIATLHHCKIATMPHRTIATWHHCNTAPLQYCTIAILHHCNIAPLQYCTIAILHHCNSAT